MARLSKSHVFAAALLASAYAFSSNGSDGRPRRDGAAYALFLEGQRLARAARHGEAAEAFSRALDLAPDYPITLIHRAHALYHLKRFAESEGDYSAFIAARPGEPNALWGRAQARNAIGRFAAAIADAEAALSLDPGLAGAYYQRAYARFRLGDAAGARADVVNGLELDPDDECLKGLLAEIDKGGIGDRCEALVAMRIWPGEVSTIFAALN
jgi:tetratricopeptide (TPR) repeat protein